MPILSVIVPVYKVEPYLCKCIDSILNQTFTNLELILVDDGSPDTCSEICDEYKEKDCRVKVIHKRNGGLSSARNAGLELAEGEYISFVDSDDWICEELFEITIPYMKEYDMVRFNCCTKENEIRHSDVAIEPVEFIIHNNKIRSEFLVSEVLKCNFIWAAWAGIYKKSIIEEYSINFVDNEKIFAEDLCFFLWYTAYTNKILYIQEKIYFYFQRTESIMGTQMTHLNVGRMNELSKEVLRFYIEGRVCQELIDAFPAIHYGILMNAIRRFLTCTGSELCEERSQILSDIDDINFFVLHLRELKNCKDILNSVYGNRQTAKLDLLNACYLANGNKNYYKICHFMYRVEIHVSRMIRQVLRSMVGNEVYEKIKRATKR